nr:DNA translocase FtsK [Methylobacterium tarhaniae]
MLTRARRREAEPAAAPAEARPRPAPAERPAEAGVRFTRTPDHVLQARQRRREQALREKEEARLAAEAEAAARAAAELAAAEAARAEAEAVRAEAEAAAAAAAVPLWRQPFVLPPGVRFTRTPDHLLRHAQEEAPPAEAAAPQDGSAEVVPVEVAVGEAAPEPDRPAMPSDAAADTPAATAEPVRDMAPVALEPVEAAAPQDHSAEASADPEIAAPVEAQAAAACTAAASAEPVATASSVPDLSVQNPVADAPAAPAQVFDVPNSAILVPVDVSHLRSLPPRPVYALDRLLQHDWTRPLPITAEQDNRPLPEPVAEESPVLVEAPPAAEEPAEEPALPAEPVALESVDLESVVSEPVPDPDVETVAGAAPELPADSPVDRSTDVALASEPAAEAAVATTDVVSPLAALAEEVSAPGSADDLPQAAILLPAPAPMLALTYAPLAATAFLPVPVEPQPSVEPLPSPVAEEAEQEAGIASEVEAALEATPAVEPELVRLTAPPSVAPLAFTPVPWSFIAADALPVAHAETVQTLPAVTVLASTEDRPASEPVAESASPAAPRGAQPFVYVPTGRLNAQPPSPTLPAPPRPPRIILPVASQPVPTASQPVPPAEPPASPASEPETVATAPSWSPSAPEKPAAEPHGLVIGTAGLDCDLGLDGDEDGDDEDDILAPVATIPLRQAARAVEVPYELPSVDLLAEPRESDGSNLDPEMLEDNALQLQQVIQDFGVRGEILAVRPGPVVTLYEMEPAPGTKSSRVISLADDIARSMSAISARVAVVQGRNAIGIELPNLKRETVYLRELLTSPVFTETKQKLALCLGKNIGGEAIIADLARMPHLLVAGTTGSGKSVAINTMILSLLYRMKPEECRLIMVDPKMLELSVYDGIPHLLSPVVTDPKKAVIALKWAVREMEERYKKMSKLGVRNIDGFNARVAEARARGEVITRTVQTGFDRETGEAVYEDEVMDLSALPYIVIVVDEMADLMMVAGKDIEGAIQRLAQMARAAGLHLIMATQRPSVDVITGTIKANFPTRISFQVTSKIDSRTILGEMGAEQLLGQGDMLFMAGGGRTTRGHGPFCSGCLF